MKKKQLKSDDLTDDTCLRFIHCIPYTSAARGFIKVLFKLPLNTFIIVRFRLWHLLMKS